MPCPRFTFGLHCSKNCFEACVIANTESCTENKCECKSGYYGERCEEHCKGVLQCPDASTGADCVCELTLEQKVELLTRAKAKRDEQEAGERGLKVGIVVGSLVLLLALIVLSVLVYKLKRRTKKLKKNLELGSAHYTGKPGEFLNPIYQVNLRPEEYSQKNKKEQLKESRSFKSKLSSTLTATRSLFDFKTLDDPKLTANEKLNFYETIDKNEKNEEAAKPEDGE